MAQGRRAAVLTWSANENEASVPGEIRAVRRVFPNQVPGP